MSSKLILINSSYAISKLMHFSKTQCNFAVYTQKYIPGSL